MAESDGGRMACPVCKKQYRWNTQLAGRKVKCKACEAIFRIPTDVSQTPQLVRSGQSGPVEGKDASGYELDIEGDTRPTMPPASRSAKCPSCNSPMTPAAVVCINCGFNHQDNQRVATETDQGTVAPAVNPSEQANGGQSKVGGGSPESTTAFIDLYLPLILIAVGFVAAVVHRTYIAQESGILGAVVWGVLWVAVSLPAYLLGIIATSKIMQIGFGPLHLALLKLAAIALGPKAMGLMAGNLLNMVDDSGLMSMLMGSVTEIVLYWILFAVLFSLDVTEWVVCIVLVFLINLYADFILKTILITLISVF